MTRTRLYPLFAALIAVLFSGICSGQVRPATGLPPFGSFGGGPFDTLNLGNLNAHFAIPVLHKAGRGMAFSYDLSYDSSVWSAVSSSGSTTWVPIGYWGWTAQTQAAVGYLEAPTYNVPQTCNIPGGGTTNWSYSALDHAIYHDKFGVSHYFYFSPNLTQGQEPSICTLIGGQQWNQNPSGTATATDGSRMSLALTIFASSGGITTRDGETIAAPINVSSGLGTDLNGNQITVNTSGQFLDTLSSTTPALTVAGNGTPASPITMTYAGPSGSVAYKMNYTSYTVKTNFGLTGISEYGPISNSLVSSIMLPDNSSYFFTYEVTPGTCTPLAGTYSANCITGRIASVTLPTGGTITYGYTGGPGSTGIESDGSTAGLTRTLNPGGQWTYARSYTSTGTIWTTTVTDPTPAHNQTVINFQEDSGGFATGNFYETQRVAYVGTAPTTPLLTQIICYDSVNSIPTASNCPTIPVTSPIAGKWIFRYPLGAGTPALTFSYHSLDGFTSSVKEWDFGVPTASNWVRSSVTTYGGQMRCPEQIQVFANPSTLVAQTTLTYNEGTLAPTTNTPQHVAPSTFRCNATTIATQVNGTETLYRKLSYYDTGTLHTSSDYGTTSAGGSNVTTYTYNNTGTPSPSCGNSFVTSISESLGLSTSATWNCTGGVATQVTDENGKTVTTNYTDPYFWRPANVVDQKNNPTIISYSLNSTTAETNLSFNNGSSVSDIRATLDGFGRPILSQRAQTPTLTNYDSTETDYDVVGRVFRTTMPFQATAGGTSSTAPATTVAYDALGRPTLVTDGGGGTVGYTYTNNDVLLTAGPTPNFKKQLEYDGLGRLTSVCEITTTLSGNGPCGQTTPQTGYWTKYTYDVLNNLIGVTQNAQAAASQQTRSFAYDMTGRLTTETNPETGHNGVSGTVAYTYDVACGSYPASAGDLTTRVDNAGNKTCFGYDGLHRLLDAGNAGPTCRHYRYDTQTPPTGVTVTNTKARAAEAYTNNCSSSTKLTDEWFGYDASGNLTDVYESTPHSGGYYHSAAAYWPTGALNSLSAVNATSTALFPTIYYGGSTGTGLDGEGRVTKVNAASGVNPVTSVTYQTVGTANPVGSLTAVVFGSTTGTGDYDYFNFYKTTGRPSTYQFAVNGVNDKGTLTWNANGTLGKLVVADSLAGTTDSQTCNYAYDDVQRLSSANCGTPWTQTFTYDPFGNISKSGSSAFQPLYSTANTNQFSSIPGVTVSYDANGNLLRDNFNTYTWDPNWGNPASINSTNLIYDANGQMLEQQNGTTYTQMLYSPAGKTAIMNGQALTKAFVGLPGGGTAVYNSSGLAYYRHADWLGSSRLTSTASRTVSSDSAYAPFGEQYANFGPADSSFTGNNADTTSSLYDFTFREHSPSQGRWISPDPSGLAVVNPGNPQSWNRYAYVNNNPLALVDPLGLDGGCDETDVSYDCLFPGPGGGDGGAALLNFVNNGYGGGGECTLDGVATPCSSVSSALSSGSASQCPYDNCGPFVGSNGYLYSIILVQEDGWLYINPTTGNLFGDGSERGLPSLEPDLNFKLPLPNSVPSGKNLLQGALVLRGKVRCNGKSGYARISIDPVNLFIDYVDPPSVHATVTLYDAANSDFPGKPSPVLTTSVWETPFLPGTDVMASWQVSGRASNPFYKPFKIGLDQSLACPD